jgi:hypothetical protein
VHSFQVPYRIIRTAGTSVGFDRFVVGDGLGVVLAAILMAVAAVAAMTS